MTAGRILAPDFRARRSSIAPASARVSTACDDAFKIQGSEGRMTVE